MADVTKVAVAGASRLWRAGEILRLLLGPPCLRRRPALDRFADRGDQVLAARLADHHPTPDATAQRVIEPTELDVAERPMTWCFLGLPHGHSAELAEQLGPDTVIIDCGAGFSG